MELPTLEQLEGFEWDEGNQSKIESRMTRETAEAAFLGEPMVFCDERHSQAEPRWFLMNRVGESYVFIAFTIRKDKIRVLSARYMHRKEVRKYGKSIG